MLGARANKRASAWTGRRIGVREWGGRKGGVGEGDILDGKTMFLSALSWPVRPEPKRRDNSEENVTFSIWARTGPHPSKSSPVSAPKRSTLPPLPPRQSSNFMFSLAEFLRYTCRSQAVVLFDLN